MTLRSASCSPKHTENTPITAVWKVCLSVSRHCLSRPNRTGKPVGKSNIDPFSFGARNTYSAHNQFPAITQAEKMVDRTGKPVGEISSSAQIRTLFDEQRTNDYRRVLRESFSSRTPSSSSRTRSSNSTRRIMESAKGFSWSSSTESYWDGGITKIPEYYLRYAREVHRGPEHYYGIIWKITRIAKWSKLYERYSKDFQDAESVRSGNSHVTNQPMLFPEHPIPEGLLKPSFVSPRRKEGLPDIWDTPGISGNVFANPHASSTAPYPQELNPWRKIIEEPLHMSTAEKSERPEQNQDLRCQSGPSAKDSVIFSGGDSSKNFGGRPTTTADFWSPLWQVP